MIIKQQLVQHLHWHHYVISLHSLWEICTLILFLCVLHKLFYLYNVQHVAGIISFLSLQIREHKLKYFTEFWNILDVFVLVVSYVCIAFSVYRTVKVNVMLDELLKNPEEYADFEYLAFWQSQFNNAVAVAVFFAWIKVRETLLRIIIH